MIVSLLLFAGMLALLFVEGLLILRGWASLPKGLTMTLAFPVGAVSNVLLFFLFTVAGIPLSALTIAGGHLLLILIVLAVRWLHAPSVVPPASDPRRTGTKKKMMLMIACVLLLANTFAFSAIHALVLPSLSIDVFTNWTMRSKVSWQDRALAFDPSEIRGVAKPQYPFLVHALQITANAGRDAWSDHAANAVTWFLTMSALGAAFLLLKRMRGALVATVTLTMITQIPLLGIHLSAGYADIHLTTFGILGFLTLALAVEEQERAWLGVSALMVLGALWSKSEGLYFVFFPWAAALVLLTRARLLPRGSAVLFSLLPLLFFLPFLVLLTLKGLPWTPHESDSAFGWQWAGFAMLPRALWASGSLGILWFALPLAVLALLRDHQRTEGRLPLLLIALLSFLGVLAVYLFTPNVDFLLNSQSFYRQLLLPASLFIVWCAVAFREVSV